MKNSNSSQREAHIILATGLLYLVTGIVCTQVPLLNYLGYESSFLFALLGSIVTGTSVIAATQRFLRSTEPAVWSVERIGGLFRRQLLTNLLLLLIPLLLLSANVFLVKNCAYLEGLGFFLLLPCVSVWFSATVGLFCSLHYRHGRMVFFSLMIASWGYALFLGYATPAIFSYNFFYGYFPGFSYDEALGISRSLVLFRVFTAGLGAVALWMAFLLVRSSAAGDSFLVKGKLLFKWLVAGRRIAKTALVVTTVVLLYVFRCEFGWESTRGYIQQELGGQYNTPHVTLYYTPSTLSLVSIRRIGGEHEFRLAQLARDFGLTSIPHVESYLYPDAAMKWRLIGAGNTNIAKPWSGQIHCTQQSLETTLKHELAHVMAAPFGVPVIDASLRTGLVEGLATALDGRWLNRTLHGYAAALQKFGPKPQMAQLMSFTGFASQNSTLSYVAAGSFCRYLMDGYGMKPVLAVYGMADFKKTFGKSLPDLVAEWERFLGRMRVEERERDVLDTFFRQPPIFRKTCARVIARRNDAARAASAERNYARARDLYNASFREAGGDEAFAGLLAATVCMGDYSVALRLCDSVILRSDRPAQYLPLFLWYGDARWATGDISGARQLYQRLLDADLADGLTENAAARLLALEDSLHRPNLLPVFLAGTPDSVRVFRLDSLRRLLPQSAPLLQFLAGRELARKGESGRAVEILQSVNPTGLSLPLDHLRRKILAEQEYLLGDYEAARTAFWLSLDGLTNEAAALTAREWVTRCDWMKRHGY